MTSKLKLSIAAIAAIFMVSSTGIPANASPTTLSYAQFQLSFGYVELEALNVASDAFLASQSGIEFNISVDTSLLGQSMTTTEQFLVTKTATFASITSPDEQTGAPFTINFGFANGSYFEDMNTAPLTGIPNAEAALGRLGKSATTNLIYDSAEVPDGLSDISPDSLLTGETIAPLSQLSVAQDTMTYSPVSKAANSLDATSTDYSFSATVPASGVMPAIGVLATETFDSSNHLREVKSVAGVPSLGLTITMTASVSVNNSMVLNLPTENNSVHKNALAKMGKRISAEKTITTKAKAIATKAKALAKAAKKTLVAKHITDAAKALKYKVSSAKNGVKLTATYQSVSGSMCVVATKGAAVVAPC
jgi:hypothetical protein